jgi:hypothetical protein
MHVDQFLPESVEVGAVRVEHQDNLEVTHKDSGRTVRNSRVETEPGRWEISFPTCDTGGDTATYDAVRQLWRDTERGLHTFNFRCFVDDEVYRVRFASPMPIAAPAGHLRHIETMTIEEDE